MPGSGSGSRKVEKTRESGGGGRKSSHQRGKSAQEENKSGRSRRRRGKAKADREAAKEEEKRKRINEARYPIDDDELREELMQEAKEKGIELSSLLRPLPKPVLVENGQVLADGAVGGISGHF